MNETNKGKTQIRIADLNIEDLTAHVREGLNGEDLVAALARYDKLIADRARQDDYFDAAAIIMEQYRET